MEEQVKKQVMLALNDKLIDLTDIKAEKLINSDDEALEQIEKRISQVKAAIEAVDKEESGEGAYIKLSEMIEKYIDRFEVMQEKYLHLKYGVEYDRATLASEEAIHLESEEAKERKLTNDAKRKAYLKEVLSEEYTALFNKRWLRDNARLQAVLSNKWISYYMARFEHEGDIEVENKLLGEEVLNGTEE